MMKLCDSRSYECNESIATKPEKESSLNREVDNHNTCTHTQRHTDKYIPIDIGYNCVDLTYTQDQVMQQYRRS